MAKPKPKIYEIWATATHTGDLRDMIDVYYNRGHAVARLRGLIRKSWLAGSEINYVIRSGVRNG